MLYECYVSSRLRTVPISERTGGYVSKTISLVRYCDTSLICTTFVLRGNARKRPGRFPLMTGPFSGGTRGAGPPPPAGRLLVLLRLARATLLILPCLRVVKLVVCRFWGALRREAGTDDRGHQDSCVYFNVTYI